MKMPKTIGLVHFIGIGGIGMSGIAEVLHNLGHRVQGSDQADSANVQRLREKGISISIGHKAENLGDAEVVVVSTAIKKDNPELIAHAKIPAGRAPGRDACRADALPQCDCDRRDPWQDDDDLDGRRPARCGRPRSDGDQRRHHQRLRHQCAHGRRRMDGGRSGRIRRHVLKLPADIAVVTNIDPEHLDHYGSFDAVRAAFRQFVENVPFYGFGVLCLDHPEVQSMVGKIEDRKVVTYGENPQADVRFHNIRMDGATSIFDIEIRRRRTGQVIEIKDLRLPMPGRHNVSNATAAVAVAQRLGIKPEDIARGLATFGGVKRRFTLTGEWNGARIFDDYGHHPVEIRAVLRAAREACQGRIVAVHQPHRYSRLSSLFEDFTSCFNDADTILLAPVYAAGEEAIEGVSSEALVDRIKAAGHRDARHVPGRRHGACYREDCAAGRFCGSLGSWQHYLLGRGLAQAARGNFRKSSMKQVNGQKLLDSLGSGVAAIRGRLTPDAPMDRVTWFRAGGLPNSCSSRTTPTTSSPS